MDPNTIHTNSSADLAEFNSQAGALGLELGQAMRELLAALPGAPLRPTALARLLGIHRVIASKLINAIACAEPYEVLQRVPGPESLRTVVEGGARLGVSEALVAEARQTIERFATLIRQDFGTRGALNAAISPRSAATHMRFEHASRYHVFKGMRQIVGVEAEAWITSMIFVPSGTDDDIVGVTTIQGALGMRRLRPDANAYFTFGPPYHSPGDPPDLSRSPVALHDFYTHAPAHLETHIAGEQLVHRLADDRLGRKALADMLAVSHNARGSRRYGTPERPRGGVVVYTDIPAKTLVCDAILHDSVFPGAAPEFRVYKPGTRGPANPNDPNRDIDRIEFPERVEALGKNKDRFIVDAVPNYTGMILRVCEQIGVNPRELRVFRLRIAYPVPGFQYVMAFEAPRRPA